MKVVSFGRHDSARLKRFTWKLHWLNMGKGGECTELALGFVVVCMDYSNVQFTKNISQMHAAWQKLVSPRADCKIFQPL
jgi:hypothetical protein